MRNMSIKGMIRTLTAGLLTLSMLPLSACSMIDKLTGNTPETSPSATQTNVTTPAPLVPPEVESAPALAISELMARNTAGVTDGEGNYCGWIELHNLTDCAVMLSEYAIEYNGKKHTLPATELEGGGYLLLYANGKGEGDNCSFTLGSSGTLTLWHGDLIAHKLNYVNKTMNYAFVAVNGAETAVSTPGYGEEREPERLIISELMSNNSVTPVGGALCDYVELYNDGTEPIDLSDFYASEKEDDLYDARLPEITLAPGEYALLICDKDLPFGLSKNGGVLYITRSNGVMVASATYGAMSGGQVYTHDRGIIEETSPGHPNTYEGMCAAINDRKGLVISEVITSNGSYLRKDGEAYDVVELWNNSDVAVNLSDYYFSDSKNELQRYKLPDVTLEAGGYYTFLCSGTAKLDGTAHVSISSEGEKIFLSKADGSVCDALNLPAIPYDVSFGRSGSALAYFDSPTLGKANGKGCPSIADAPKPSLTPGIYNGAQTVTLQGEGTIYYTLDGSRPTADPALIYQGEPIECAATTAIRTFSVVDGKITSPVVTYNYLIDTPDYTLPVMKITVKDSDVFGENGIYTKYNDDLEKDCSATLFVDGKEEFSVNCGLKIFGGTSRMYDKKSFQLKFKAHYGTSKLHYKVFDDLELDEFDSLVLRSGSQGMMRYRNFINDEVITSLAASSGAMPDVLVQAYRPCNLYINGEYFGVYFIREKIDDDFVAAHYGVSPESVTVINWTKTVKYGSDDQGWVDLYEYAYANDLSDDAAYRKVADQLCLESLIDVYLMRMWACDRDSGNIRAFRSTEGDGKWRFILFDTDISFESGYKKGEVNYLFADPEYNRMHGLIRSLLDNAEFRALFLSRFEAHCTDTFSEEKAVARIDAIASEIEHDMQYNVERWPQYHKSLDAWKTNIIYMKRYVSPDHLDNLKKECILVLDLTAEEVKASFGEGYVQYCG